MTGNDTTIETNTALQRVVVTINTVVSTAQGLAFKANFYFIP